MEVDTYRSFQYSSQQAPPLPNRPASLPLVDNDIYQSEDQREEERSLNLGERQEPEGGN